MQRLQAFSTFYERGIGFQNVRFMDYYQSTLNSVPSILNNSNIALDISNLCHECKLNLNQLSFQIKKLFRSEFFSNLFGKQ
jgi:hypothetical protein